MSCNMTDRELATITLFQNYPDSLLNVAAICCIVFMCIGIPGNFVTFIALARYEKVRNATAISIMNLSCSDLLFCCFNLPFVVSTFYRRHWTYGCLLCRIFAYAHYGFGGVSLLTVLLITINRYILISHPKLYPKLYRRRNIKLMLSSTWFLSFGTMIFPWFGKWGRYGLDVHSNSCNILSDSHDTSPQRFLIPLGCSLPMIAIIICYARIFYIVRKATWSPLSYKTESSSFTANQENGNHSANGKPNEKNDTPAANNENSSRIDFSKHPTRKDRKLGTMIMTIVITFCICHLPTIVLLMLSNYRSHPIPNLVGYILLCMSPCINPVIYVFMSSSYRKAYKNLLQYRK